MSADILIVDDETAIADLVEVYLKNEGFTIHKFYNASDALACVRTTPLDLAVLDVMLPDMDGFTLCQRIREDHLFPIIMLTAKVEDMDKIMGLTLGADDYITKPFSMLLLGKRVAALLRRCGKSPELNQIQIGDITVDFGGYTASGQNGPIDLTPKEIDLLKLLVEHKGLVLTRSQILDELWGYDYPIIDRTIDTYIKNLRKKLGLDRIVTVKGVGYKYEEQL